MFTYPRCLGFTIGILILNIAFCGYGDQTSFRPTTYQMVEVPSGKYRLMVPIVTSFSVEYIPKDIEFQKPFQIGKYEVTNQQWQECFEQKGCSKPAKMEPKENLNHPVARVNWHQAYEFTKWISKVTGKAYRLPTEEEWTYATYMRETHYEVEEIYDYSNLNFIDQAKKLTKPQGAFGENKWGVSDTEGNVWEWTLTCWYASEENILKIKTPTELNSPTACFTRIAIGENRSHIPDFIFDTYNGGCATLRPAANLGFRLLLQE